MPVATLLAVAATFWSTHGYTTTQPVLWAWDSPAVEQAYNASPADPGYTLQAYAPYLDGRFLHVIVIGRAWWDAASTLSKCEVLVHEYGHAEFGFAHRDGTVMSAVDDGTRPVPGTCKRSRSAWRTAARAGA